MELKEFKTIMKDNGYKVSNYDKDIYRIEKDNKFIKYVSKNVVLKMLKNEYEAISFINYKLGA